MMAELGDDHREWLHGGNRRGEGLVPQPAADKSLEAAGVVRREIDATDLRRHRLLVIAAGRKVMTRGLALLRRSFSPP